VETATQQREPSPSSESKSLVSGKRPRLSDLIFDNIIKLLGYTSIVFVILIFVFLLKESLPLFKTYPLKKLLLGTSWYPTMDPPEFGLAPLILGSLLVTAGAVVIALPLGIGTAVYISEVAPSSIKDILKSLVELLAAIPSVVMGFVGMIVLAPWIKEIFDLPTGLTALAGSITLAFMAVPTVTSIAEDALAAVPTAYRTGSLALGATKWQTISQVVVPAARSGIVAASMLGVGRAIGETMTVLMVTGNAALIPRSFLQPVRTMTATIAAEMGETVQGGEHYQALFVIGLLLFIITFIINLVADLSLHRVRRQRG
jgi:phosphate transport system permease protein